MALITQKKVEFIDDNFFLTHFYPNHFYFMYKFQVLTYTYLDGKTCKCYFEEISTKIYDILSKV